MVCPVLGYIGMTFPSKAKFTRQWEEKHRLLFNKYLFSVNGCNAECRRKTYMKSHITRILKEWSLSSPSARQGLQKTGNMLIPVSSYTSIREKVMSRSRWQIIMQQHQKTQQETCHPRTQHRTLLRPRRGSFRCFPFSNSLY